MTMPKFEGKQVAGASIALYGIGDGLSDALDVEPVALQHGQQGYMVVMFECRDVDHVPIKKHEYNVLVRKHGLATIRAALVSDEDDLAAVRAILEVNYDRVSRAKDSMRGQQRLDDDDPLGVHDDENGAATVTELKPAKVRKPRPRKATTKK